MTRFFFDLIGRTRVRGTARIVCGTRIGRSTGIAGRCTRRGCTWVISSTRIGSTWTARACRTGIGRPAGIIGRARICRTGCCCARVIARSTGIGTTRACGTWISRTRIVPCPARVRTTGVCRTGVVARPTRIGTTGIRGTRISRARVCPGGRALGRGRIGDCRDIGRMGVMIKGNRTGRGQEDRTEKKCVFLAHFRNPSNPNAGRSAMPTQLPAKARTNHNQPCTLPDAIPLKNAPILQPNARRAP